MFDEPEHPLEPHAPSEPGQPEAGPIQAGPESSLNEPEPSPQVPSEPELSAAQVRFRACRWHSEVDNQRYCANRDVLPYAGKGGFDPEAWCPDCALYKLRRTPKKRSPRVEDDDYGY